MKNNELDLKKNKISMILNTIIVIFTIIASIIMFTGFKFMHGSEPVLESTKIGMFKFFTVDSNLFMGLVSLLFVTQEYKLLKGKIDNISIKMYILKLMATTGVGLTFFIVFAYLGPISDGGISSMLMNSNLFFHLLIPILSMITFILFESTDKLEFKKSFYGLIPTLMYALYYLINVLIHMENAKVSPEYDWYWFVQNGVWTAIIVVPMILFISYIISLALWKLNRIKILKNSI